MEGPRAANFQIHSCGKFKCQCWDGGCPQEKLAARQCLLVISHLILVHGRRWLSFKQTWEGKGCSGLKLASCWQFQDTVIGWAAGSLCWIVPRCTKWPKGSPSCMQEALAVSSSDCPVCPRTLVRWLPPWAETHHSIGVRRYQGLGDSVTANR